MMKVKKQVGKSMLTLAIFALLCAPFDVDAKIIAGGSSQAKYKSMGSCIYPDRASAEVLVTNFLNTLQVYTKNYGGDEAQILFNYKNQYAWEQDMKPGEWKYNSIDDVNFMIYAGHGLKKGTYFLQHNSLHYFTQNSFTSFHNTTDYSESSYSSNLETTEAAWGKTGTKTRWVALFTCNFLNPIDSKYNNMMQGISICMGFETTMYLVGTQGWQFASDMGYGYPIIDSFLDGCEIHQTGKCDNDVVATAIYYYKARNDTIYSYNMVRPVSIDKNPSIYRTIRRVCKKKG